jgi:hypothetical protein
MLYFAAVRPEDEFDDGDSTELGQLVIHKLYPLRAHSDVLRKEINEMIAIVNVLRSCQAKYRFLDEFLFHITMNNMKRGVAQTGFIVRSSLDVITANEAGEVARSFVMLLMSNVNGEAAVDEYVHMFPALTDLDHECRWFRPTMVAIATELMSKVAYGVKVRAGIGGTVSILDLVSDVVIIAEYIATGRNEFAHLLIGMVTVNILYQLFIVWAQTRGLTENKWRTMLGEMLATVLFIKPGLDAWKVATGAEQQPGSVGTPLMEMSFCKSGEMVFEAIPGFVLQVVAVLTAKDVSTSAVVSLLISAASTGLTATTIFYDNDVDPGVRKRNPVWCGAIPNQGRGLAFFNVFVFCTLHVLAKGLATALLYIANFRFLMLYIAVDYGLCLVYFAARKDVVVFVPMPPTASWIVSPIFRVAIKVIGDFSGTPILRIPLALGGSYYLFNLISAQASVMVAVHLYTIEMAEREEKIAADTLWRMATFLVGSWCVAMLFFLARVVAPSHRHTFCSPVSGRQCVHQYYTEGVTDEDKMEIFGNNRLLWESDIGSEVIEFTMRNWARWERDKPAWFTAHIKATVPDECIPREFLAGLGGADRMRRGSAAISVRESFRMIEDVGDVKEIKVAEDGKEEVEEKVTKIEVIEGVERINDIEDAEDAEEGKEDMMMEEGAVNIMNDVD